MSTHEELSKLSPYLDGELDAAERRTLDAHISTCAECTATLGALRATVADLKVLAAAEVPELDVRRLRAEVLGARGRESKRARFVMATGAVAAGIIAFTALVLTLPSSRNNTAGTLAEAPALREGGAQAVVLTSQQNYDAATARRIFDLYPASTHPAAAGAPSGGGTAGQLSEDAMRTTRTDAGLRACEARVLQNAKDPVRALLYLYAQYEGRDAYFLLYDAPASAPTRRELWVVRPVSCEVVRFEQRKL